MSAFESFAFIYDQIMDEQLYEDWLDFTLRHLGKENQLLELACGTGELAIRFAQKGFEVTALDLSEEMLSVAHQRAENKQADLQFVQADMLDLTDMGTYEVVTCYSDSICYLADELEVQIAFNQAYQVLRKDGIFLFDVHSLYQIEEIFPDYNYHYQTEDFAFLWESYPGEFPHSIEHFLTFFIKNQAETFSREDELHLERTYPIETYKDLLKQAGFKDIKVCADFKDSQPTNNSKRWFFVCYK